MFPQLIMVKFWVLLRMSSSKTQMLLLKQYIYSSIFDYIVVDSLHLNLTFVAFCLLSVTHKQQLYCNNQSELLSRLRTVSSVWNFCYWGTDVPPGEVSLAARSEEKQLFSQATWYVQLSGTSGLPAGWVTFLAHLSKGKRPGKGMDIKKNINEPMKTCNWPGKAS